MDKHQALSWIFLSIYHASKHSAADLASVASVADSIAHEVPTHKEMEFCIPYLVKSGLVNQNASSYSLTSAGYQLLKRLHSAEDQGMLKELAYVFHEMEY